MLSPLQAFESGPLTGTIDWVKAAPFRAKTFGLAGLGYRLKRAMLTYWRRARFWFLKLSLLFLSRNLVLCCRTCGLKEYLKWGRGGVSWRRTSSSLVRWLRSRGLVRNLPLTVRPETRAIKLGGPERTNRKLGLRVQSFLRCRQSLSIKN